VAPSDRPINARAFVKALKERSDASVTYAELPGAILLIDPVVPADSGEAAKLWRALGDLEGE